MDISKHDCFIIRKDGRYLMAVNPRTRAKWWSIYKFDACPIRSRTAAAAVAEITGGKIEKFNFILGV